MRVTTKGQVTIPQDVRQALGIVPGTELDFRVRGSKIEVVKADDQGRGAGVVHALRRAKGWSGMSTDELMALTRRPGR